MAHVDDAAPGMRVPRDRGAGDVLADGARSLRAHTERGTHADRGDGRASRRAEKGPCLASTPRLLSAGVARQDPDRRSSDRGWCGDGRVPGATPPNGVAAT